MPFSHGVRISEQYIAQKTREIESSFETQHTAQSEPQLRVLSPTESISTQDEVIVDESTTDHLPVAATPLAAEIVDDANHDVLTMEATQMAVEETPAMSVLEDAPHDEIDTSRESIEATDPAMSVNEDAPQGEVDTIGESTETTEDLSDNEETHTSISDSEDKSSLTTEETASVESSDVPKICSTDYVDVDERHSEEIEETQSAREEDNVSIAESLDFTISVSMTDDDDDGSIEESGSNHISALPEDSASIEAILATSLAEGDKQTTIDDDIGEGKHSKSLVVNDSMTTLVEGRSTVSPKAASPHIIKIAVEDGEEEYFQSTTSRDSFLIKLSLLGALNDVVYDDFVEQVCEYKALVMTIVKRYEVALLREVQKPEAAKSFLIEHKTQEPRTFHQEESKKQEEPLPAQASFVSLQCRKQALQLEPLELPDFSYVEELVKQSKAQIRQSAATAEIETAQEDDNDFMARFVKQLRESEISTEQETVQENQSEAVVEEVVESSVEESGSTVPELVEEVIDLDVESRHVEEVIDLVEMRDEDLEVREKAESREVEELVDLDVESEQVEEVINLIEPTMPQRSRKFRAVIEILEDGNDEPTAPEESASVPSSKRQTLSTSSEAVREIEEVRESAREAAPHRSLFTTPEPKVTKKTTIRRSFAPKTTMATIRAEVEAKYSKMARPTSSFDRGMLYTQSTKTMPVHSAVSSSTPSRVTMASKAPVVRVATAYAAVRRMQRDMSERVMPEIIDLVDVPEPMTE